MSQSNFPPKIDEILFKLAAMDAGPEFEIPSDKLKELAHRLISEGEQDELSKSILEIKDNAQEIGNFWLMCPICQEAWESTSKSAMVRCPNCKSKLHNPATVKDTLSSA